MKIYFRNVDAEQLTRAQSGLHDYFGGTAAKIPLFAYFPRPDKESENPFLPDFGNEMLKRGEFEHVINMTFTLLQRTTILINPKNFHSPSSSCHWSLESQVKNPLGMQLLYTDKKNWKSCK